MKIKMKRFINFLVLIALVTFVTACDCGGENKQEAEGGHDEHHESAVKPTSSTGNFGATITAEEALAATELPNLLAGKETIEVKLVGNVESVCQMSGCWMDVEIGDGETVHVTFQDDEFLMPKDAAGKKAVIEGVATYEEIPVSMLKHLAEDDGKTQAEIDSITEPAMEYTFVARGVILEEIIY
jgi:hypothetical protein